MADQLITAKLYLDTNVFIEMFEKRGDVSDCLLRLFAGPARPAHRIVTSQLTLAEILVDPIRNGDEEKGWLYEGFLQDRPDFMTVAPVSRAVLHRAALIRARQKAIKLPDAIHIATAREANCNFFLMNDRRIGEVPYFEQIVPLEVQALTHLLGRLN
jgi:predicted nucleic acid-binding protein